MESAKRQEEDNVTSDNGPIVPNIKQAFHIGVDNYSICKTDAIGHLESKGDIVKLHQMFSKGEDSLGWNSTFVLGSLNGKNMEKEIQTKLESMLI